VGALLRELETWRARVDLDSETVFVGGGTPTVLPLPELHRVLSALAATIRPGHDYEFTVEANPATVSAAVAECLVAAGVNRVSLGAQSFDPRDLRVLDRRHNPRDVGETMRLCRAQGLHNISLDLIFGVPGQSVVQWRENLDRALDLGPEHLSCYGLTYEPGTPLYERLRAGRVCRVDEGVEAEMYETTLDTLAAAGFEHYEISNFARPGRRCRHNLVYWRNQPCLGIGPSAAGLVDGLRYRNVPDVREYVADLAAGRSPAREEERLDPQRRMGESAMLALRLRDGLDRADFLAEFERDPLEVFADAVKRHAPEGLLAADARGIRLTRAGLLLANRVLVDFVSP